MFAGTYRNRDKPPPLTDYLKEHKELKDASEGWWEKASVGDSHLEEERMKESIPNVDQGVLVEVADPTVVSCRGHTPYIIVHRMMVVVGLVFRHLEPGR